jgi:nucleotide-binding universal stress UspA family protein
VYDKILVPLDGTDVDEAVLSHIQKLAPIHHSKVYLMRVVSGPVAQLHGEETASHEVEETEEYLRRIAKRLEDQGIPAEMLVDFGDPAKAIVRRADELGCDLIAMSTHGHKFLQDFLYGSVASKVRHEVRIPVLLIRGRH